MSILNSFKRKSQGHTSARLEVEGSKENPYLVTNAVDLAKLIYCKKGTYYKLMNDIHLSMDKTPSSTVVVPKFKGIFDGSGFKISNLQIRGRSNFGLFGTLCKRAVIKNLGLENISVTKSSWWVGGLVGRNLGSMINCYVTGSVTAKSTVGGLVGINLGTIDCCYATCKVLGDVWVGGLVGVNANEGVIRASYATGSVEGKAERIGGLTSTNCGKVENCYATGSVSGSDAVGGLVGDNAGDITNCYATGSVYDTSQDETHDKSIKGFVGHCTDSRKSVTSCFYDKSTHQPRYLKQDESRYYGEGKNTTEMMRLATFAGWSIGAPDSIWKICEGSSYPQLSWQ